MQVQLIKPIVMLNHQQMFQRPLNSKEIKSKEVNEKNGKSFSDYLNEAMGTRMN